MFVWWLGQGCPPPAETGYPSKPGALGTWAGKGAGHMPGQRSGAHCAVVPHPALTQALPTKGSQVQPALTLFHDDRGHARLPEPGMGWLSPRSLLRGAVPQLCPGQAAEAVP